MRLAYVANVGDGLCVAIRTTTDETLQIDCGSTTGYWNTSGAELAFDGLRRIINLLPTPSTIFLSHIHNDHYNGFFYADSKGRSCSFLPLNVKQVVFPGIPVFSRRREFLYALLTMNFRLLGDETGIPEYDLVQLMTRLNNGVSPKFRPVYAGDHLIIGSSHYSILWPPRTVAENDATAKLVVQALQAFERAVKMDEVTRKWHTYVRERSIGGEYLDGKQNEMPSGLDRLRPFPEFQPRELPGIVDDANKALRKAANRLSLSFYEESADFIFMGDMESKEIKIVVNRLLNLNRRRFSVFVTPHHGTHWDKALLNVKCNYAVSSCGPKRYRNLRFEYDRISLRHRITWKCGDVICWTT